MARLQKERGQVPWPWHQEECLALLSTDQSLQVINISTVVGENTEKC
jgi:hypothetical protein